MINNYPIRSIEFDKEINWRKCPTCGHLPVAEDIRHPKSGQYYRLDCPNCGYSVSDIELAECAAKWNKITMNESDIVFEAGRILASRL
jgi:predicted RNA-binding Zn-ribbon protein involved in translation (DUF1610 family)